MRGRMMSEEKRIIAVLVLVTVAILGYLAGHGGSSGSPASSTREAANAVTLLNYASTSGWQPASRAPAVPGLPIAQPVVLAPKGDAPYVGLVVGQLSGEWSPLPSALLERLRRLPSTEVVQLLNTQAYRYSPLSVPGFDRELTLYTIPVSATAATAIACYASAGFTSYMPTCEQLAATLSIATGKPQVEVRAYESLTPDAGYARELRAAIARVDGLLLSLRPEIRPGASRVTVARLARRLAEGLGGAVESLSVVPPTPARRAHGALAEALRQARAGYSALAVAVSAGKALAYAAARTQVYLAEARLGTALKQLNLLGYR
jgi:hypothetical protein